MANGDGALAEVSDELMRRYRRKGWHDEFARYVEYMATQYPTMPDLRNASGTVQWVAASNRGEGDRTRAGMAKAQ